MSRNGSVCRTLLTIFHVDEKSQQGAKKVTPSRRAKPTGLLQIKHTEQAGGFSLATASQRDGTTRSPIHSFLRPRPSRCLVSTGEAAGGKSGRMMGEEEGRGFVLRARRHHDDYDDEGVSASPMTTAR